MTRKTLFIGSTAVLLLAFIIGALVYHSEDAGQSSGVAQNNLSALVRPHAPSLGNPDAKVHIVEFLDPACGTCREFYPFVKALMAANPDRIRISIRYAPFHQGSDQVVKLLEAARKQGKYWQTLEAVFASQSRWVQNHRAQLLLVWGPLEGLGLDLARIRSDMNSPEIARVIQQDSEDANTLNVTKTPEFFVNGRPMPSFGYEELKKLVDDALADAYR